MPAPKKGQFAKIAHGHHEGTGRAVSITFVNEEDGDMPIVVTITQQGIEPEVIRFPQEALDALGQ